MNYEQFNKMWDGLLNIVKPQNQRIGQWYYNCLYYVNPKLAEHIETTEYKIHYKNSMPRSTFEYIKENWNEYQQSNI